MDVSFSTQHSYGNQIKSILHLKLLSPSPSWKPSFVPILQAKTTHNPPIPSSILNTSTNSTSRCPPQTYGVENQDSDSKNPSEKHDSSKGTRLKSWMLRYRQRRLRHRTTKQLGGVEALSRFYSISFYSVLLQSLCSQAKKRKGKERKGGWILHCRLSTQKKMWWL